VVIPAGYVWRWIKAVTKSRSKTKSEIRALKNRK